MSEATSITPDVVGLALGPVEFSWSQRDMILYALGIGAELPADLDFLWEGPPGQGRLVPTATFALAAITRLLPPLVDHLTLDLTRLLHLGQSLELLRPLPARGSCQTTRTVIGVRRSERAAVLSCEDRVFDADGTLARGMSEWWVGGAGAAEPSATGLRAQWPDPVEAARPPDRVEIISTHLEQAALYRLSGDLNPVHIDPEFAVRAGQPRPLLHGLCTFGTVTHRLNRARPEARIDAVSGRFMAPVFPGDDLVVRSWNEFAGAGELVRVSVEVDDTQVLALELITSPAHASPSTGSGQLAG